jgi:glycosyltransferase involved in cell wall biosynthesis
MNGHPTISAVIIAQNEASKLPGLLGRLGWVDDIVVIDGGSKDCTVKIAESWGARVFQRPFDTFARQRNFALAMSRSDWVLSIDADERPTPAFIAEVQECLADTRHNAFHVPIRSSIFGRPFRFSGTQDDRPIRLMRRKTAHWEGDVHEVLRTTGSVGAMSGWLEHETLPDLPAFLAKMHRYTRLAAMARVAENCPPRWPDAWIMPPREVFRRLIWKFGFLDGPEGWAFCLLSGLSEWCLATRHRRFWAARNVDAPPTRHLPHNQDLVSHTSDDATDAELLLTHGFE